MAFTSAGTANLEPVKAASRPPLRSESTPDISICNLQCLLLIVQRRSWGAAILLPFWLLH